jgi:glycerol uptake facilitator-like aquaporin
MEKFLNLVLGTNDVPTYLAALFFAMFGVLVILLLKSKKRDKTNRNTPDDFSFKFLIVDNLKEIVLGFLLILIALRFSVEYAGASLTMWYALGVGLSIQKLSGYISKLESGARK